MYCNRIRKDVMIYIAKEDANVNLMHTQIFYGYDYTQKDITKGCIYKHPLMDYL